MSKEKCLEIDNLLAKLGDSSREGVILRTKKLNLGLEVGEPLLLTLSTLEGSNPDLGK